MSAIPDTIDGGAYMKEQQGKRWQTIEHETHVEYQTLLKDLVLESEFLGGAAPPSHRRSAGD